MSYGKRRLSVLLCILMVLTTVFVGKPETQLLAADMETEAAAESSSYGLSGGGTAVSYKFGGYFESGQGLSIQKGAKDLNMGDYLHASTSSGERYLSQLKGATYKSNKTSVVKINKKTGKMEAKKTGTATITVTYSGESRSFKIKVVKSTSKYKPEGFNTKNAKKLISAYGNGITEKNRYKLLNAFKNAYSEVGSEIWMYDGIGSVRSGDKWEYGVYSPVQARAYAIYKEIEAYGDARNPITTPNSKSFQIQKLSGKGKTITATLKKNVTKEDIFGVQYSNCKVYGNTSKAEVKDAKTAKFTMYIMDKKTNKYYEATATVTKGSDKMTIKLKNMNLKKGRTYKIPMFWAEKSKVTTFKAK